MKLVTKLSILLCSMMVALVGANYLVVNATVMPTFAQLEQKAAKDGVSRVIQALDREKTYLHSMAQDWSFWDDTRNYATTNDESYVKENLMDATFTGLKTEAFFIIGLDGSVKWGQVLDLQEVSPLEVPSLPTKGKWANSALLHAPDATENSVKTGLIMTENGIMVIASAPILTSQNKGPAAGTLMFGRLLTPAKLDELRAQTGVAFELLPANHKVQSNDGSNAGKSVPSGESLLVDNPSSGTIHAFQTLIDVSGKPLITLKATTAKDITKTGQETLITTLLLLTIAGLVLVIGMAALLRKMAISPVLHLTETATRVGETGDLSLRNEIEKDDEIGALAAQFNAMLADLEEAKEQLREQSYYTGVLEMSAGLMHNLRNTLNPIAINAWKSLEVLDRTRLTNFYVALDAISNPETEPEKRDAYLAYIKGAAPSIAEERELLREKIAEIAAETKHVEGILEDHNRLNRPEMCVEQVDLEQVVQRATKQVPAIDGLKIEARIPEEFPLASSNYLLLSQVIGNLMVNSAEAIEAAKVPNGEINLEVELLASDISPRLVITISDNGEGFMSETKTDLFKRGFSTRKEKSGGLGLHWCANTLTAMGGRLSLESDGPGKGAVARIELAASAETIKEAA